MQRTLTLIFVLTILSYTVNAQWSGSTTTTGVIQRNGKVILNSTTWDDHLEILRGDFGGVFKPDWAPGRLGLGLDLKGSAANFYILNGNVGIGTASPQFKLHIQDAVDGGQIKFQRGTGVATILQDNNVNNLYLDAAAGLLLNTQVPGNVGIGTTTPDYRLHIKDGPGGAQLKFQRGTGIATILQDNHVNNLYLDAAAGLLLNTQVSGNVGIGTTTPDAKLTVKGDIHTREVRVDLNGAVGPDYVFEKNYDLLSLSELETYIIQNKHLPEVPSAKEMEENGLNLKEMNLLLLKKVEELTLHLIEQNKKNEAQQKEIDAIKNK